MSARALGCPTRDSANVVKKGKIHTGKQNHKCTDCGRQYVEDPHQKRVGADTKRLIDELLLEKIPLAGIARVADVSEVWLQPCANAKSA